MQNPPVGGHLHLGGNMSAPLAQTDWHSETTPGTATTPSILKSQHLDDSFPNAQVAHGQAAALNTKNILESRRHNNESSERQDFSTAPADLIRLGTYSTTQTYTMQNPDEQQFVTPTDLGHRAFPIPVTVDVDEKEAIIRQHHPHNQCDEESDLDSQDIATPSLEIDSTGTGSDSTDDVMPTTEDISSLILKLRDPEKIKQVLEALRTNGLLEGSGYKKETTPKIDEKPVETDSLRRESANSCAVCEKGFLRRCELK